MFSIKPPPRQMNIRNPLSHSQRLLSELTLNHHAVFFGNYFQSVAIYLPLDFHFHKLFIISGRDFIYCLAETQTHFDYIILFCQSYLVKKFSQNIILTESMLFLQLSELEKLHKILKKKLKTNKNVVKFLTQLQHLRMIASCQYS